VEDVREGVLHRRRGRLVVADKTEQEPARPDARHGGPGEEDGEGRRDEEDPRPGDERSPGRRACGATHHVVPVRQTGAGRCVCVDQLGDAGLGLGHRSISSSLVRSVE